MLQQEREVYSMSILSNTSIKTRLIGGFLFCVLLTGIAIAAGVWSIVAIRGSFTDTTGSFTSLLAANAKSENDIRLLRDTAQGIRISRSENELETVEKRLSEFIATSQHREAAEMADLIKKEFLPARRMALVASEKQNLAATMLAEKMKEMETLSTEISLLKEKINEAVSVVNRNLMDIADTIEFETTILLEETIQKAGSADGSNNAGKAKTAVEKSIFLIREALSAVGHFSEIKALTLSIFLAKDQAKIDYALSPIETLLQGIESKIGNLPQNESIEKIKPEIKNFRPVISDIQKVMKQSLIAEQSMISARETLKEASTAMQESITKMETVASSMDKNLQKIENIAREKITSMRVLAEGAVEKKSSESSRWMWILICLGIFAVIFALTIGIRIAKSIIKPVSAARDLAEAISRGNLFKRLDIKSSDEIGQLSASLDRMAQILKEKAGFIDLISKGDISMDIHVMSGEDAFGESLKQMVDGLNDLIGEINESVKEVDLQSRQIAESSQMLSQNTSSQASSVEEISASMTELASQTNSNAQNAAQANQLAKAANEAVIKGADKMKDMTEAMNRIRESSNEINNIIKTIDGIAFQTNLLALNAAVEAARAGKHGKGFAVVAQEVRNLAARSSKAAQDTSVLIESAVNKAKEGTRIVLETSEVFAEIEKNGRKTNNLLDEIATASHEQAQGISQVNIGISQIDTTTMQNTSNAEETAAASQEMQSQANNVQKLLTRFKLKKDRKALTESTRRADLPVDMDDSFYLENQSAAAQQKMITDISLLSKNGEY
jgi:methyl-accepting chemotaxis protein